MAIQSTAETLFQTAYESRYTWDENFPGYAANVQLLQEGEVYSGKIQIDPSLNIQVTEVADQQIAAGIDIQLQEVVTRYQKTSFLDSYGQHEFILGESVENDGVMVFVKGGNTDSHYQIRNQKIYQEVRVMGRMALEMNYDDFLATDCGYIPSAYHVVFRNSQTGDVNSILKFTDTYQKFGDYYILTKQIVAEYEDGKTETPQSITEFVYSHIQLSNN
ncbi:DUF3386 domain-containing protein [Dolichospermum circinale CS-534/05]|uniref:DUF3386 domain-containing protein n=1 Tax=Dolichospermum circinale CS-537/01 TaxID=3021739 RepID=A0ABT5A6W8_9CYAN|nr:DUF3386 domain-containing protein [Dolichospermum circinale]MDB9452720.1 DUF3386 domain-containing protein [Dolichospermum circinale CS-541/06]MDB9464792.1 DUF3386 domain-containing protein [Dolichospermum circinale CS-541/04]MDB9487681.1 DUF3386 domain-containing protein [Dolichospermum circinale CS-537/01]MDB9489800.1 DUF3386 domain-containing protein [Dolichospermum circinale CS-534/05]MDB9545932.1 DUF3386 domain-containing protein [Dolichospermum circinale CS-1031]